MYLVCLSLFFHEEGDYYAQHRAAIKIFVYNSNSKENEGLEFS